LWRHAGNDAQARVAAMNDLVAHRGPDGVGVFAEGPVVLGHRRLAIVDLSAAGAQPMHRDERYVIVFNGEVYNHVELRAELEAHGHRFGSHTDTEVILAAYVQWGEGCLDRFNGMWAFLIYDRQARTLLIARDRFGIKPLYYWVAPDGGVAFASEIKQFTSLPGWRARLNSQRTYDFLNWGVIDHTDETLFAGVFQLRGGEKAMLRMEDRPEPGQRIRAQRWYSLPEGESDLPYAGATSRVRELLGDSVRLHLRADVPVGSCLSGGLDSSSIVCLMHEQLHAVGAHERQNTFSACAREPRYDERPHMETVIHATGAKAHFTYPSLDDLFRLLDKMVWHQDEPFGSSSAFAQWQVFGLAASHGVKVMLDGQGADEQLAGYLSFRSVWIADLLRRGRALSALHELRASMRNPGVRVDDVLRSAVSLLVPGRFRDGLRQRFGRIRVRPAWLNDATLQFAVRNPYATPGGSLPTTVNETSRLQVLAASLPMLLHFEDRNSMAHSVEARVPFLDYRLVELIVTMPAGHKIRDGWTKRVLRDAMRGVLPEAIRLRSDKLGFETPEEIWLRTHVGEFRDALDRAIDDSRGVLRRDEALAELTSIADGERAFTFLPWRLICFGAWMRVFSVDP
jgi:asparagine synthase (glutamine-hydrolysing)